MRISDLSNLSELVTDKNAVFMQYTGTTRDRDSRFTVGYNFVLATSFWGEYTELVADDINALIGYLYFKNFNYTLQRGSISSCIFYVKGVSHEGSTMYLDILSYSFSSGKEAADFASAVSSRKFDFITAKCDDDEIYIDVSLCKNCDVSDLLY